MIDTDDIRRRFAMGGCLSPDVVAICDDVIAALTYKAERCERMVGPCDPARSVWLAEARAYRAAIAVLKAAARGGGK